MTTRNNERIDEHCEPFLKGYNDYFDVGQKDWRAEAESSYISRNYQAGWAAAEADDKRYGERNRDEKGFEYGRLTFSGCLITILIVLAVIAFFCMGP